MDLSLARERFHLDVGAVAVQVYLLQSPDLYAEIRILKLIRVHGDDLASTLPDLTAEQAAQLPAVEGIRVQDTKPVEPFPGHRVVDHVAYL